MKFVYASIFALLISSTANAQNYFQDNLFGDNVIQNNYYNRPARVVKKIVRVPQKTTTVITPPVTVVTPPPVTVIQPPPVTIIQPVPVIPYYVPVAPVPVYGGYYGYY